MAIPTGTKFQGIPPGNDDLNKRSAQANATAPLYDASEFGSSIMDIVNVNAQGTDQNTTALLQYNSLNLIVTANQFNFCCILPVGTKGKSLVVINRTGRTVSVFPPDSTSSINNVAGVPTIIPPDGKPYTFFCIDNPVPSIWSISSPATKSYSIDFQIAHTKGSWTGGWAIPTGMQTSPYAPGVQYYMPYGPNQTGSFVYSAPYSASDFYTGPFPLTLTKKTIFTNIRNEMSMGSQDCSTGSCNTYGAPNDYPQSSPMTTSELYYQNGPILQWNLIQDKMEVNGVSTGGSATKLIDSNQDFTTCFNGSPPLAGNPGGTLFTSYGDGVLQFVGGFLQGTARVVGVSANELTLDTSHSTFGTIDFSQPSTYKIIKGYRGQEMITNRAYFKPKLCCTFNGNNTRAQVNQLFNTVPFGDFISIAGDSSPAPTYAGNPGDSGTQFMVQYPNYNPTAVYNPVTLNMFDNQQAGSAPLPGTSIVTGDSRFYYIVGIPNDMATKTYKFTIVYEGF